MIALTAGASHTCALLREGLVRCWGDNSVGQLGLGTTANLSGQPPYKNGLVPLGAAAVALTAGDSHTCALMANQSVRCWGANADGQLGLGNTNTIGDDEVPDATHAAVPLGAKATAVAAGGNDTCAILQDGSLRCWGLNDYGQLGLGNTNTIGDDEVPSAAVAEVSLGDATAAVAAGGEHTCALLGGEPGEQLSPLLGTEQSRSARARQHHRDRRQRAPHLCRRAGLSRRADSTRSSPASPAPSCI